MENFRTMNCTGCQCNGCYECSSANCDICYRAEFANKNDKDMYHEMQNKKECDFDICSSEEYQEGMVFKM